MDLSRILFEATKIRHLLEYQAQIFQDDIVEEFGQHCISIQTYSSQLRFKLIVKYVEWGFRNIFNRVFNIWMPPKETSNPTHSALWNVGSLYAILPLTQYVFLFELLEEKVKWRDLEVHVLDDSNYELDVHVGSNKIFVASQQL